MKEFLGWFGANFLSIMGVLLLLCTAQAVWVLWDASLWRKAVTSVLYVSLLAYPLHLLWLGDAPPKVETPTGLVETLKCDSEYTWMDEPQLGKITVSITECRLLIGVRK
jgi:hypothetical protein